jgi:dTDP-4-dehydrorhamnose reductase
MKTEPGTIPVNNRAGKNLPAEAVSLACMLESAAPISSPLESKPIPSRNQMDNCTENKFRQRLTIPVWGGIECTVHRLGDCYGDQLRRNGHQSRISDLQLIADLGINTLRYPIIWEKIAPNGIASADWSWADERLNKLRELNIKPIVTLLHHGSGPKDTSLIDPDFPQKFTEFAMAVAQRYRWLELFTPINEPLTTARFSCLYGAWYPHARDDHLFSRAVLNQCKATIMAMQEIKRIIPHAKLVQTEDLGKCHGTRKMQYQCDFENDRRWTSLDLISGALAKNPTMLKYFLGAGKISENDLAYFFANGYPPDIIGINHYLTSERFLDEDRSQYPEWSHAKNGRDEYSDVDILRADIHQRTGHYPILKSVVERYGLPIALTEVHLGSTRDAQLRWFMEAYDACTRLQQEGVDIKGITAWSMLGAYDWNTLLTQQNNFYESGVFDVRTGVPRPTALARLIKNLCAGETPEHPVLLADGWWKNPEHVHFMFGVNRDARGVPTIEMMFPENLLSPTQQPILITGATGTLGRAFAHICAMRNISYVLLSRRDLDITDQNLVMQALARYQPWAVINAAGFVNVDEAESMSGVCFRENAYGPVTLADACEKSGIKLLTFSTDLVFDGGNGSPYLESNSPAPLNVYGASKLYAETHVLKADPSALVVRTSAFFGPWDEHNFITRMMAALEQGQNFFAVNDQVMSPTYVPDLVNHCLDLVIDDAHGIWHLANSSVLSWADFAAKAAEAGGLNTGLVKPVAGRHAGLKARRPAYSALGSEKGILLPNVDDALDRYLSERCASSLMLAK